MKFKKPVAQHVLIMLGAVFFTAFYNFSFFRNLLAVYGFSGINMLYVLCTALVLTSLSILVFSLLSAKYLTKGLLICLFSGSAFAAYFMDSYGVVIDSEMVRNTLQTNLAESMDLFSFRLVLYVLFLAVIPSYFIFKVPVSYPSIKQALLKKIKLAVFCLAAIVLCILGCSKFYASFFREHKSLRYSINPFYWTYSIGNYINKTVDSGPLVLQDIGTDAKIAAAAGKPKELVILVIGEAARADRFALNGYARDTNPLLAKENVISFGNMFSCGTSTAFSVPCMFSIYPQANYSYKKAIATKNLLDVLKNTNGIDILWRDNNSDSKGVALRMDYEDFRSPANNRICDEECRDVGMLDGLDQYIKEHQGNNILIVLHQMGNHGPAYYKRYPKEFEKFTPVCKTNQLENCSQEEISNAYDNAILYTDYFLAQSIAFLKPYQDAYKTALFYVADHGESLGEKGLYLHGLPYPIAPKEQKHVGSLVYLGQGAMQGEYDMQTLKSYSGNLFSHDNLFHTLLGMFDVKTQVYKQEFDLLYKARNRQQTSAVDAPKAPMPFQRHSLRAGNPPVAEKPLQEQVKQI